jgi:hypothetical protein
VATTEPPAAPELSPRTLQTYAQDWALFTDWCAATGNWDLPADPDTILEFLAACPATRSAQRCRVAAIDHHHAEAGFSKPGESAAVRAALGRPVSTGAPEPLGMTEQVIAALQGLPSHGWTQGMFGRRDRCLLVLSRVAGVPYKHLASVTVGEITVVNGTATVTSPAGAWTVTPDDNPILCGSCAVVRWLRIVDVAVTKISTAIIADAIDKSETVTAESPHLCRSTKALDQRTTEMPVFPPIDQWGALPFPLQPMTPHSLSRRVRDILAGDLGAHRHLPVDRNEAAETGNPAPDPVAERRVYSHQDAAEAWNRRRADLRSLDDVAQELTEVDRRLSELNQRAAALLADDVSGPTNVA